MNWSMAWSQARVPCCPASLPGLGGERIFWAVLQIQHMLVLTPSWGWGGSLWGQEPLSWEEQREPRSRSLGPCTWSPGPFSTDVL